MRTICAGVGFGLQPVAPVLLLWLPWTAVVAGTVILNILWAIFVRYQLVNVRAAFLGAAIVPLKWLAWPAATVYLFVQGRRPECWVAFKSPSCGLSAMSRPTATLSPSAPSQATASDGRGRAAPERPSR